MKLIKVENSDYAKKFFCINWAVTNKCNYSCGYCHDDLRNGNIPHPHLKDAERFVLHVFEKCNQLGLTPFFELGGGEVTSLAWLPYILKLIKDNGGLVSIITNLSKREAWWDDVANNLYGVYASFHYTQNKDKSAFLRKLEILNEKGVRKIHVNVMMIPEFFDTCYSIAHEINEKLNCSVSMQPLYKGFGGGGLTERYDYNPEQSRTIQLGSLIGANNDNSQTPRGNIIVSDEGGFCHEVNFFHLIQNQQTDFRGWSCYSGCSGVVITFKGDIYRSWCMQNPSIGSIYNSSFNIVDTPVICNTKICQCGCDLCSLKVFNNGEHS